MKRSEIVKHIQEWVTHPVTCMPIWTLEEASELLTTLEEYGMLPPHVNDKVTHTCKEFEICTCSCVWEPESQSGDERSS